MTGTEPPSVSPDVLDAIAEQRRLRKEQRKEALAREIEERSRILPRGWVTVQEAPTAGQQLRVMTWNLLAQSLVRRELFPTSDCLKAAQRENMIYHRLEKLLPVLEGAGYVCAYAAGPRKKHGCAYRLVGERMIEYDLQEIRQGANEAARRGSSFRTRNIASLVALQRVDLPSEGIVVATTHLFWHPSQAAILLREVHKFRDEISPLESRWPCIIAGDFNFPPDDAAYSLFTGDPLLSEQEVRLATSRVVHKTIDPDVPAAPEAATRETEEDEGAAATETDPDRIITNARPALPVDGLLTNVELADMLRQYDRPLSRELTYGDHVPIHADRRGVYEPNWTSYTYRSTPPDYMFVVSPPQRKVIVTKLAKPHRTDALSPGIPLKGVWGAITSPSARNSTCHPRYRF
ncbi:uncharacterized protein B0H18DRAFT_1081366 [Fomitopsis serialis]|uniref:uncharacterized protein n=1 Tax=Fomitopsis serialis TaxID=139415 RepID=UPI0020073851|nr:uncharacterized protein B0H18DRAFT_1081366 [Neoantrodia serialis]KAH9937084.1 hypothetical protein B0H18DRAFT_1081366 [Neoantrodia serialis]